MATNLTLDGANAQRLADRLAGPQRTQQQRGPQSHGGTYFAKITGAGASSGRYTASQVAWNGSAWAVVSGGNSWAAAGIGDLRELSGNAAVATDSIVQAQPIGDTTGGTIWTFSAPASAGFLIGKVSSKTSGQIYSVALYGNGSGSASTATVSVTVLNVASAETLAANTWLAITRFGSTYEGIVYGVFC